MAVDVNIDGAVVMLMIVMMVMTVKGSTISVASTTPRSYQDNT